MQILLAGLMLMILGSLLWFALSGERGSGRHRRWAGDTAIDGEGLDRASVYNAVGDDFSAGGGDCGGGGDAGGGGCGGDGGGD